MPPFIRIQDIADILIMSFLLYQLYSWFKTTRAMQVLLGLGMMTIIYFITRFLGLYMTSWILQELGTVLIVLIIVVFQAEIRQTLYRFSLLRHLFDSKTESDRDRYQEIAETVFRLASRRVGAILVFQRNEAVADYMINGVRLDSEISPQILESIFATTTPLHDGAALLHNGRVVMAACHLPLSVSPDLPQYYGTRHRAALGLAERTDAVVITVSEERGEVSLAQGGELRVISSIGELITTLEQLICQENGSRRETFRQQIFSNMLPKVAILLIVTASWVLITSRQGQLTTITVPISLHGVPEQVIVTKTAPEEVEVQVKTLSGLIAPPTKLDLVADLDLSSIREGQSMVHIRGEDIKLPSGLTINTITPSSIRITAEKKIRRLLPVRLQIKGALPNRLATYRIVADPATVPVEGPASHLMNLESIPTEEIDAATLENDTEYHKQLAPQGNRMLTLKDHTITIHLVPPSTKRKTK